jgi:hypothetical protein
MENDFYPNMEKERYPNVKIIKSKVYSGTGGRGFWSITRYDTEGNIIEKEYHRKGKLIARENCIYNFNKDILYKISTFDINDSSQISDTTFYYEYKYKEGRIIYQKLIFCYSTNDSIVTRLISNEADTTLVYQTKSFYFRPKTNTTGIYETNYTLNYKNGQLVCLKTVDEDSKTTTFFEYYPDGKLKCRTIERESEEMVRIVWSGGHGADDMFFKYKLDRFGRIKTMYYIIKEKKYKIATYKYWSFQ